MSERLVLGTEAARLMRDERIVRLASELCSVGETIEKET